MSLTGAGKSLPISRRPASRSQRILLASNREPFQVVRDDDGSVEDCVPSMGGLASGLSPILDRRDGIWVCWNPEPTPDTGEPDFRDETEHGVPFPLLHVGLTKSEMRGYYNGFCNRVLWPMCHTILRRVSPRLDYWTQFRTINERFADVIAGHSTPGDLVWLHDYHLMLVPAALRKRVGPRQRLGYFHHIPFPKPAVLKALPWHRHLLLGLLGADAVGFHTSDYAVNFIESCGELADCDIDSEPGTIIHNQHRTVVRSRPIGIEAGAFARLASDSQVQDEAHRIRGQFPCDCFMLSIDRLDYTKGLVERIEAIHELFTRLPQCRGIVTFLQIAVPTRTEIPDYQQYRARFEASVKLVNAKFGTDEWQPIVCRYEPLSRRELVAHYLAADVACVTPVADGMNLVALEYCASRIGNDGVLLLSEQAGASNVIGRHAVAVDILNTESVVAGLVRALTMPASERERRMLELRSIVMRATTGQWARRCLDDIRQPDMRECLSSPEITQARA